VRSSRRIAPVVIGSAAVGWNGLPGSWFSRGSTAVATLRTRTTRTPLRISSSAACGVARVSTVTSCPRRTSSSLLVAMLRSSPPITGA
jgi:hypothetical protein